MKLKGILTAMALMALAVMMGASSCSNDKEDGGDATQAADKWASLVNETKYDIQLDGTKATYGTHTYSLMENVDGSGTINESDYASVSFSHIPSGYTEFEAVYTALLGKSIVGTAAMIPMAMEIYARDNATGTKCIELLCGPENATTVIRSLQSKFKATSANADDPYIQRYLPAALLRGATPDNAYNPYVPYTVVLRPSVNAPQAVIGGTDTFLYILTFGGWDSAQRQVEIFQKTGSDHYTVYNCPSVYAQCKPIVGTWVGLR